MPATRDMVAETQRKASGLAYVVRGFLNIAPEPPCSICRRNGVECPLCRLRKAAVAALGEWDKK
jgi:hypothetical protein